MENNWNHIDGVSLDWNNTNQIMERPLHYCRALQLALAEKINILRLTNWTVRPNLEFTDIFYNDNLPRLELLSILSFCYGFENVFFSPLLSFYDHTQFDVILEDPVHQVYSFRVLSFEKILNLIGQTSWIDARKVGLRCNDLSWMPAWLNQCRKALNTLRWVVIKGYGLGTNYNLTCNFYKHVFSAESRDVPIDQFPSTQWSITNPPHYFWQRGAHVITADWHASWSKSGFGFRDVMDFSMLNNVALNIRADIECWYYPIVSERFFYPIPEGPENHSMRLLHQFSNVTSYDIRCFDEESYNNFPMASDLWRRFNFNSGIFAMVAKFDIPNGFKFRDW